MYADAASRSSPAVAPMTLTTPASGSWRPATSSSSVDLPQPDGPTTATSSPARTSQVEPVERHDRGTAAVAARDAAQRDPDVLK